MIPLTIKTFEKDGEHYAISDRIAARLPKKSLREWKFQYEPLDTRAYLSIATGLPDMIESTIGRPVLGNPNLAMLVQPYIAHIEHVLAIEAAIKEWDWKATTGATLPITRENIQTLPYRVIFKLGNVLLGREFPEELLTAFEEDAKARREEAKND